MTAPRWATRVQGLLLGAPQPEVAGFKLLSSRQPDLESCNKATAIYAGETSLTVDDFLSLTWLDCFARSGRQLLLCHALRLLQGWTDQPKARAIIHHEIDLLHRLCAATPDFAFHLAPELMQPLVAAVQQQVRKVWSTKPRSWADHILKADVLFQTSKILQNSHSHAQEAIRLWDLSVPYLVAGDGSPTHDSLTEYVAWISPLLAETDVMYAPATRQALDRAMPFLAMLVRGDGQYCFTSEQPANVVKDTPPLRHAYTAHAAHLKAGKTTVITVSQPLNVSAQISVSTQGHHLFDACFAPTLSGDENTLDAQQTEHGQLIQHAAPEFQRTVFLSPKGDDLRVEERRKDDTRVLYLKLNPNMRISIARVGTQATLSLGPKNLWQLSLRGGSISATTDAHILRVNMADKRLNWALKSIVRAGGKSPKSEAPELPF